MTEQFSFYWQGCVVCIIVFLVMLVSDMSNANRQEKQVIFQRVLVVHILYFFTDIFYKGLEYDLFRFARPVTLLINTAEFVLVSALAIEWFFFIAAHTDMPMRRSRKGRRIIRIPFLAMLAVIVVAYLADPMFWLSETGERNRLFPMLMLVAPMIYFAWSTVYALIKAFRKEHRGSRKLLVLIALYPVSGMVLGSIQRHFPGSPLYNFGIMIVMVYVYIQNMKDQISTDPLTRLNNRTQLVKYVSQETGHHSEELRTYVVMVDVNDFKKINDSYGHAEGDRTLVLIAAALTEAGKRMKRHPFIGRYGGDEFILIVHCSEENEAAKLSLYIRGELDYLRNSNHVNYELSVGIGYEEWKAGEDFQSCMIRADKKLYIDKSRIKYRNAG